MKNKFIKSTIILLIGGGITKILGMFIKIITTRYVGEESIGIYMLVLPTFSLFVTLATLGLPIAISKLVSENKYYNKRLVLGTIPLISTFNIILMLILFLIAPTLSTTFLHEKATYYPLLAIGLVIPFVSISSIIKGYFFGKEKMFPYTCSNIFEQLIHILAVIIIIPLVLSKGITPTVTAVMLINIISELASIFILFFFLPKNFKISKSDFKLPLNEAKDVLSVSIPTTASRLVGNFTYFLEPIILSSILLHVGYSNSYIIFEYGVIAGYVLPLLLIPSFFTSAISQAMLPILSSSFANKQLKTTKKYLYMATSISFIIGLIINTFLFLYPNFFLKLIFNTTSGASYLKILSPIFLILYIQGPLVTALQAINQAKYSFFSTTVGNISKLLILIILSPLKIGIYPLIIGICANIIISTIIDFRKIKKIL